ncbi:ATP-binding protein [Streptosporangium nondiastaticum]|uniref:ATP-binding protein n=1 Tax=Streptosporangium nondiastaticum TaxID=35764 RepID=UPI0016740145|nr:ATP-binding protein [Streptosporangium nondiastaticum]
MTLPTHFNPYAVHVPVTRGGIPKSPPRDDHPLIAWQDESHAGQWVDVDHAQDQLQRFDEVLDRIADLVNPGVDQGSLVVVTGPRGMGKTTLIHQCIYRAILHIEQMGDDAAAAGFPRPITRHVVAMTAGYGNNGRAISRDENGEIASAAVINANIREKVFATLRAHFPNAGLDPSMSEERPFKAFGRISSVLAEQQALLFVVVPHIDWTDQGSLRTQFLDTCLSAAQSRIVLFVEISHETTETAGEAVEALMPNDAVTHLMLGGLREGDTVKFSQDTGADHSDPDEAPLPTWQPADVRELRQACHAVADGQIREGRTVRVTARDLNLHAAARDPLQLQSLRRRPVRPYPRPGPAPADPDRQPHRPGPTPGPTPDP